jgi:hypothetical protein
VTNFKHAERMSRRQVAERLTDVAYALVVRSPAALQIDGQRVRVPDAEELLVQWDVGFADGRLRLQMEVGRPGTAGGEARLGTRWESAEAATRSAGRK